MEIKGLNKKYLTNIKMTVEEIVQDIEYKLGKNIKTITILSAGWDAMFGNYVVIRAGGNKLWIISDGEIVENNGWVQERGLL